MEIVDSSPLRASWVMVNYDETVLAEYEDVKQPFVALLHTVQEHLKSIQKNKNQLEAALDFSVQTDEEMQQLCLATQQLCKDIDELHEYREPMFIAVRRATESADDYSNDLIATYHRNVAHVNLPLDRVYPTLGLTNEEGVRISCEGIQDIVTDYLNNALFCNNEKDTSVLRQVRYFFSNEFSKEEYDAFLQDKNSIKNFYISDPQIRTDFINCFFKFVDELSANA